MLTKKIDLHGNRHKMARTETIRAIEDSWGSGDTLDIITGHSPSMKAIVTEVIKEYDVDFQEGDVFGTNKGFIRVYIS